MRAVGIGQALALGLVLVLFAAVPRPAFALSPLRALTQYGHTVWRSSESDLAQAPTSFAQTADGFLWVGSSVGVQRFDGVRFTSVPLNDGGRQRRPDVYSLTAASDGSLWIGGSSALVRWADGRFVRYDLGGRITGVVAGPDGDAWFTRSGAPVIKDGKGPLCHVSHAGVQCFGQASGIPLDSATALMGNARDGFWFASPKLLQHWRGPSSSDAYAVRDPNLSADLSGVNALARADDGSLWVGLAVAGPGLGLRRLVDGRWRDVTMPGLVGAHLQVSALLLDRGGALWVGTFHDGIYRVVDGRAEHFGATNGLSSDAVTALFEDAEGNLWVGTSKGLDRFRDLRVTTFSQTEGLSADDVQSVFARRDGSVVVGNTHQVDEIAGTSASSLRISSVKGPTDATLAFEDRQRRLWVGIGDGLVVIDHGNRRPVRTPDGGPLGAVIDMAQEEDGTLWVAVLGRPERVLRIDDDLVARQPTPALPPSQRLLAAPGGGLFMSTSDAALALYRHGELRRYTYERTSNRTFVQGLASAPDGTVYGSMGDGVVVWRDGRTRVLSSADGLPCSRMYAPVVDRHGDLWLYAICGLMRVSAQDIAQWWADPTHKVRARLFDATDGAQPQEGFYGTGAARSADGRLWFANGSHLQMVDPDRVADNPVAPPVHIESLVADRTAYPPGGDLQLGTGVRDVQIDYTALSFTAPQKVRFRYRLDGHDRDWQAPVSRRQAFYTDLAPGRYRFRVIAANEDGVWNAQGASLAFEIAPTFTQTVWFKLILALVVLLLAALAVQVRVRRLSAQMRVRVEERERIARELHDTLLQSTQAVSYMFRSALEQLPVDSGQRRTIERAVDQADIVSAEGRDRIHGLRAKAATTTDLAQALEANGRLLGAGDTLALRVSTDGPVRRLAAEVHDALYRMGSEAMLNVVRHARARKLDVRIVSGTRDIVLSVEDDGLGLRIDPALGSPGHWGLRGMQERARQIGASLDIAGVPGQGTTVRITVPVSIIHRMMDALRSASR